MTPSLLCLPVSFPPLDLLPSYSWCTNVSFSPFCLFGPGVLILAPNRETAGPGSPGRGTEGTVSPTLASGWPLRPLLVLTAVASDWPSSQGPGLISNPIFCHQTSSFSVSVASLCHFQPAKSFFQPDPRVWGHPGMEGASRCAPPPACELRPACLLGPCVVQVGEHHLCASRCRAARTWVNP